MLPVIFSALLYTSFTAGQPLPYPGAVIPGVTPVVPPVGPTVFPFGPTPRPLGAGYNGYNGYNPYYNAPAGPAIPILTYSNDHGADGAYSFSFSTADGKQAQETGFLKDAYIDNAGEPQGTQVVQGSYAYVAPDGTPIQVSYIADENGFRPSGVHIPADGKGIPPVPAALVDAKFKDGKPYDPAYYNNNINYNPYNYRNRSRFYGHNGQYNTRNYDPRYPYDPAKPYPYNPYNNPFQNYPTPPIYKSAKETPKVAP